MKLNTYKFTSILIADWYDGIVRAIGNEKGRHFSIILAAWDVSDRESKLYIFLEMSENIYNEFAKTGAFSAPAETIGLSLQVEEWNAFEKKFNSYLEEYKGMAFLSKGYLSEGIKIKAFEIDTSLIMSLVNYDFEYIISAENIEYWEQIWDSVSFDL